jgi:hypothetical protein
MELQHLRLPGQAASRQQPPRDGLWVGHQLLVED